MIGYITLGTNDLEKSASFYDELLNETGATRIYDTEKFVAWSVGEGTPMFSITRPFDGNPTTVGNGGMIALKAESSEAVDSFHTKALSLGAVDEGAPGKREGGFYCAYFRD